MQSAGGGSGRYGGVSEMHHHHQQQQQQFMVDSLFSISAPLPHHHHPNNNSSAASAEIPHSPHLLHHHHQIPNNHHLQLPSPHHFSHFSQHFPITQQLFHHPHHFQLFHHQQQHQQPQLGLDQESGPENSTSSACRMMGGAGGGAPSFLAAMDFKLNVNESGGGGGRGSKGDDLNGEDGILEGDGDDGSESRLHHHHHHHHPWHADDDTPHSSAAANIKQPFWRPLDIDYINPNNKRPSKDKQPEEISSNKHFKPSIDDHHHHNQSSITTPPNNEAANAPTSTTSNNYKLFSELEAIYKPGAASPTTAPQPSTNNTTNNHQTGSGSALTGDENPLHLPAAVSPIIPTVEPHSDTSNDGNNDNSPSQKKFQKSNRNRSKRRQQKHNQQLSSISVFFESLIQRLIDHQETLHRKFLDLIEKQDRERTTREDAWRAQESARASREAAARTQERALSAARESAIISFLEKIAGEPLNLPGKKELSVEAQTGAIELYSGGGGMQVGSSRWPKAEVQALIEVRSGLESRFQEPGLKGPLWEEVSAAMGRLGYGRSAKRCKEKWENINKYFRKAKDSGKKRPQQSKTCPYFQMLDQLYSNSKWLRLDEKKDNSELLDVILDAAPLRVEHSGANESEKQLPVHNEEDEEEGQGESQDQQEEQFESHSGDSSHLFHRLQT